jgi:hypothetical protein
VSAFPRRFPTITLIAAAAAVILAASLGGCATMPPKPVARELPPGSSDAVVRRFCTKRYDEKAFRIPANLGGAGNDVLTRPLIREWQACMRRNGIEP